MFYVFMLFDFEVEFDVVFGDGERVKFGDVIVMVCC